MSESCITFPNIRKTFESNVNGQIKKQQIAACLEAMVEERRFTYTDIFIKGGRSVFFLFEGLVCHNTLNAMCLTMLCAGLGIHMLGSPLLHTIGSLMGIGIFAVTRYFPNFRKTNEAT